MPGGDRTGPYGMGPMTGCGAGHCAGYAAPGFMNQIPGRGFRGWGGGGRGRGGGWGRRNWFHATGLTGWQRASLSWPAWPDALPTPPAMSEEQQIEALKGQAEYLEDALKGIRKRIEEIERR